MGVPRPPTTITVATVAPAGAGGAMAALVGPPFPASTAADGAATAPVSATQPVRTVPLKGVVQAPRPAAEVRLMAGALEARPSAGLPPPAPVSAARPVRVARPSITLAVTLGPGPFLARAGARPGPATPPHGPVTGAAVVGRPRLGRETAPEARRPGRAVVAAGQQPPEDAVAPVIRAAKEMRRVPSTPQRARIAAGVQAGPDRGMGSATLPPPWPVVVEGPT